MFGRARGAGSVAPLDPVESRVVELALSDDLTTLATSRWRRTLAGLFGLRPARPLANARLEALRQYVVLTRHARAARDEVATLLGLGFTPEQLRFVESRAAAARQG